MENRFLLDRVCEALEGKEINVILEIGSRDGNDSNFIKYAFDVKNENVHIVEPNHVSNSRIIKQYPNYNVYDFAVHNYNGSCEFNNIIDDSFIGISSVKNRPDKFYETVRNEKTNIKCITGKKLLSMIGKNIDYCQIDVEGLGFEVVQGFEADISKIKYILIESEHNVVWEDQKTYNDIKSILETTHKLIYTDGGDLQSNTLWEIKQ